ncbi:hypothetical protein [Dickeya oryzae]
MSAITDGASRFQAFRLVVLPQVTGGIIAIATFAFFARLGGVHFLCAPC